MNKVKIFSLILMRRVTFIFLTCLLMTAPCKAAKSRAYKIISKRNGDGQSASVIVRYPSAVLTENSSFPLRIDDMDGWLMLMHKVVPCHPRDEVTEFIIEIPEGGVQASRLMSYSKGGHRASTGDYSICSFEIEGSDNRRDQGTSIREKEISGEGELLYKIDSGVVVAGYISLSMVAFEDMWLNDDDMNKKRSREIAFAIIP